jgi:ATP-dependent Clp protease ATP-binding subunit ClpB
MNAEKFTMKTQSVLNRAQEIAMTYNNQYVENLHILKAMTENDEYVVNYLLKKCNVNTTLLSQTVDKEIETLPKVTGGNNIYLSQSVNTVLQ